MKRWYGWGILNSMVIAYRNLFRPVITMQYPHEKWELPERSRWSVVQKRNDDGSHRCTGCLACQKACPDFIIDIQLSQNENGKHIDHWRYELGACMMCGLCVEACPFDSIEMSHEYELARTDPSALVYDLLTDVDVAKPKRAERPAAAARPAAEKPADAGPAPAREPEAVPASEVAPVPEAAPAPAPAPAEPKEASENE